MAMLTYADYLMIISPSAEVMHEIDRFKRASVKHVGEFDGFRSRAHISIHYLPRCRPFHAQQVISRLTAAMDMFSPAILKVNGFGFFANGNRRTIYAALVNDNETADWFKLLRVHLGITPKSFTPHITIARNISLDMFNKLWPFFEHRYFCTEFLADMLTVLERETFVMRSNYHVFTQLLFGTKLLTPHLPSIKTGLF